MYLYSLGHWLIVPQVYQLEHDFGECKNSKSQLTTGRDTSGKSYWTVYSMMTLKLQDMRMGFSVTAPGCPSSNHRFQDLERLETDRNPNPSLGCLLQRGKTVPASYVHSLMDQERRDNRRKRPLQENIAPAQRNGVGPMTRSRVNKAAESLVGAAEASNGSSSTRGVTLRKRGRY